MSYQRDYGSAAISVTLQGGKVTAALYGHLRSMPSVFIRWDLKPRTALTEYTKRCAAVQRANPEMSPEQAEKVALLAWVKDVEAVGHE